MDKPVLLYYCRHADGMGGLVRALTVANRLTDRFQVVVLNGGLPPVGTDVPGSIGLIQLPSLAADVDSDGVANDEQATMQHALALCGEQILALHEQLEPSVFVIDTSPFGQQEFMEDLMPLFRESRHTKFTRPLTICSVADISPGRRDDQERRDDRITAFLDEHFDAVIVHSDPVFARLEEYFQPRNALAIPVYHSGFVVREREPLPQSEQRENRILVAAGSGIVGGNLFRAAAEAHRLLWGVDQLPMTIVAGPWLPRQEWENLDRIARDMPGLELQRSVPDLGAEFARVRWAVSHCGYNAAVDVMATGVSALLVPGGSADGSRQMDRLQRMDHWRAARLLMPRHLNGASLASSIDQLNKFEPAATNFNLDGAEITANIIYELAQSADVRPANLNADLLTGRPRSD